MDKGSLTKLEYSVMATISGLTTPTNTSLSLVNGQIVPNPPSLTTEMFEVDPANVAAEDDRTKIPLRKLAKHIVVSQIDTTEPVPLKKAREFLEKVTLPLRLGTAGRILLDAFALEPGPKEGFASKGSRQPAPFPLGRADHVALSNEDCATLETGLGLLTYDREYDLPFIHFTNAFYKSSSRDVGLEFLLGLESMFAPGDTTRGRSEKVAKRASMFAATSTDQQREMAQEIRQAYKHRQSVWHGEPDPLKVAAAETWFDENAWNLRVICSWAFQRVLGLSRYTSGFELMGWAEGVQHGDLEKLGMVQRFPLCWISAGDLTINLDLAHSNLSGGASIEFQSQFPDQV